MAETKADGQRKESAEDSRSLGRLEMVASFLTLTRHLFGQRARVQQRAVCLMVADHRRESRQRQRASAQAQNQSPKRQVNPAPDDLLGQATGVCGLRDYSLSRMDCSRLFATAIVVVLTVVV